MGLFNRLGREVEQFKQSAMKAADEHMREQCPECETELQPDVEVCPSCGADVTVEDHEEA